MDAPTSAFSSIMNFNAPSKPQQIEKTDLSTAADKLVLEDILSTHQRPELEEYANFLYLIINGINMNPKMDFKLHYEQISILLLAHYVITFNSYLRVVNRWSYLPDIPII